MDEHLTESQPKESWWSRLRTRLRGDAPPSSSDLSVGSDGMLAGVDDGLDAEPESLERGGPISRWGRREQALQKLQEGSDQLVELTVSVEHHMSSQQERTENLVQSVGQVDAKLDALSEPLRDQLAMTGTIASQLETANERAEQVVRALAELPQTLSAQSGALKEMAEQLSLGTENTAQLATSLTEMGAAMQNLMQQSHAQSDALRRVEDSSRRRDQVLTETLQEQTRRLTMLLVVALVVAAGGLAVGSVAIYLAIASSGGG